MAGVAVIYDLLSKAKGPAADEALLAAIPSAEPARLAGIVETLLRRRTPAGMRGLVEHFHRLEEPLKQQVMQFPEDLFGVLREASQARDDQARINVTEVVRRGNLYRASYLLDTGLHDRTPSVRRGAAEALCALADHIYETQPISTSDEHLAGLTEEQIRAEMFNLQRYREDRRQVVAALADGLDCFNLHLHPRIIEAAMWFIEDLGQRFWQVISTPASRTLHVATSILQEAITPRLATFAVIAMSFSEFRPHVVRWLTSCVDPSFLGAWMRQCWRISQPRIVRGMAAIKELACVDNLRGLTAWLPPETLRHAAGWIVSTGIAEEKKITVLKSLHAVESAELRRSAVWALGTRCDERALLTLRAIALSKSPDSAGIARLCMASRKPNSFSLADLLKIAQGEELDASHLGAPADPRNLDEYWVQFDDLSDEVRRRTGRELIAHAPRAKAVLAGWLQDSDARSRLRALRVVTILNLVSQVTDEVYRLAHDQEPAVRSAAVAALALLPNPISKRIVRNALSDQDRRVQANAVEAIDSSPSFQAEDVTAALMPMLASPDNRVRANAVKALLKLGVRPAAETLLRMLNDPNRAHRISALWLIDHMGVVALAGRIMTMAHSEPDPQVRQRAQVLAERLRVPVEQPAAAEKKEADKKEEEPLPV